METPHHTPQPSTEASDLCPPAAQSESAGRDPWLELHQARRDLRTLLADTTHDFDTVAAKLQQIRELEQAAGIEPGQRLDPMVPASWPLEMQAHRATHLAAGPDIADYDAALDLSQLRRTALYDAVLERLGDLYLFADCAIAYLMDHLPEDSPERDLAWKLEDIPDRLVVETIDACMDLVPALERVLPFQAPEEILTALREAAAPAGE